MLIDWFTVGAQALNFVILVGLMRYFLYKPILDAIDAREKRVAAELADAAAKQAEAKREREDFEHKNADFDKQRAEMVAKATAEAATERARLLDEAKKAALALTARREEAMRTQARDLADSIRTRATQEVFAIARKTLADLAATGLDERLGAVFSRALSALSGDAKMDLRAAIAAGPARVRSAIELPPAQRAVIQNAINETFSADVSLSFETKPELVSGIELVAGGLSVGWSIAEYLNSLEAGVGELLAAKRVPVPAAPEPAPSEAASP